MFRSHIGLKLALVTLLIILSACNLPFFAVTSTPIIPEEVLDSQVAAMRQLEADSGTPPDLYFQDGFPRFVSGSFLVEGADVVERASNFMETYQELYRIANPDLGLAVRRVSEQEAETNVVFYQSYKGIEVFASEMVVTLNGDRVNATVGGLLNGDLVLETTPLFSAIQAEESAVADLGLPNALVAGVTTLMIFDQSLVAEVPSETHLVWRVTISNPVSSQIFVDAQTGIVIFKYSLAQDGGGLTDYDFEEFNAAGGGFGDCYYFSGDHIGDEDSLESSWHSDPEAASIWWYARNTYLFYHDTFGRHSYDNDDSQFEVFIRASVDNATWSTSCDLAVFKVGWVGQDVVTHEFTHGVIESTSDLVYANQSGALNESYADVMAALQDGNWTNAEGRIGGGGAIRDLSNPPIFSQPDRMGLYTMSCSPSDNGCVHTNSGIPNKAAYLIAAGDTFNGWTINGIGNGKMGALFYATMTSLGSSARMIDARNATVARADRWASTGTKDFTAFDACQVQNAYAAVGLGDGDTDCDSTDDATDPDNDEDYIPDSLDNCPFVVNPGQQDDDSDGQGNACDNDFDNDTVLNLNDNCPLLSNTDQADANSDGIGDTCTTDDDNDGVLDIRDNCPSIANSDQGNQDGDGLGNACDSDDDSDGIYDDPRFGQTDNCPLRSNADQADIDGDGVGNACDNSSLVANPDQADADGDRIGDVSDNCPAVSNSNQADYNRDGIGDSCDRDEFPLIPDGSLIDLSIHGGPGQLLAVPIPVCMKDNCPDWFPPDYLVSIVLTDLSPNVAVWVTDDTGKSVDQSSYKGDLRVLRFRPNGGQTYHLSFLFSLDSPEGQVGFLGSMSAGPEDEQPNPTPDDITSTLLPPPPLNPVISFTTTPINPLDTETPTPTTTPFYTDTPQVVAPVILTFAQNAFCRKGPGTHYRDISGFKKGDTTQADGRNEVDPRWWWVQIPNSKEHCWVSHITVLLNELAESLPIQQTASIDLPATPSAFVISKRLCSPNGYSLQLSWTKSAFADGYTLYLNKQEIATFKSTQTGYQANPPLDKSLHYELEAFNKNGFSERLVVDDHCP